MPTHSEIMINLVEKITICEEESQVDSLLEEIMENDRPRIVSFVNAHAVNLSMKDDVFFRHLVDSDIVLRDGSGMATLFRWLRRPAGRNLNGTDLIPRIAETFRGRTAAVLGTREPWLSRAVSRLQEIGLDVVHACDGFQDPQVYRKMLEERPADLVILGMGMPKQEAIAIELRERLKGPCLIVNGGAILDFLAGRVQRAPRWIQSLGMEWSYRLWKEPRRLFQRYVIGNVVFLYSAMKLARTVRGQSG